MGPRRENTSLWIMVPTQGSLGAPLGITLGRSEDSCYVWVHRASQCPVAYSRKRAMLPRLVGSGLSGEGALWEEWSLSPRKPVVPAPPAQAWLEPLSALAGTGPGPKVRPWKSVFGSDPEPWFSWSQTLLSTQLLPGLICGSASQVLCTLLCMLPQSLGPPRPGGRTGQVCTRHLSGPGHQQW